MIYNSKKKLINTLLLLIEEGLIKSAHDISDGGLAVALAECCVMNRKKKIGATINLNFKFRKDFYLFSESQSRIIISIDKNNKRELERILIENKIPFEEAGIVGGEFLKINDVVKLELNQIYEAYYNSFPAMMESQ